MVILIVITIFFQKVMVSGYGPLIDYLPLSFAEKMAQIQNESASPSMGGSGGEFSSPGMATTHTHNSEGRASDELKPHSQSFFLLDFSIRFVRPILLTRCYALSLPADEERGSRWTHLRRGLQLSRREEFGAVDWNDEGCDEAGRGARRRSRV